MEGKVYDDGFVNDSRLCGSFNEYWHNVDLCVSSVF